jgi:hypothetical protein
VGLTPTPAAESSLTKSPGHLTSHPLSVDRTFYESRPYLSSRLLKNQPATELLATDWNY